MYLDVGSHPEVVLSANAYASENTLTLTPYPYTYTQLRDLIYNYRNENRAHTR